MTIRDEWVVVCRLRLTQGRPGEEATGKERAFERSVRTPAKLFP